MRWGLKSAQHRQHEPPRARSSKPLRRSRLRRRIIAHSIIAVDNPEDPKAEWDDGVVAYSSAHIDGVASELVHSGHWRRNRRCHQEVRRILVENLKD